jgi:hypothetical protein
MRKKSASFVLASKASHRLSNQNRSPFPSVHDVEVPDSDSAYGIPARAIHPPMNGSMIPKGSERIGAYSTHPVSVMLAPGKPLPDCSPRWCARKMENTNDA